MSRLYARIDEWIAAKTELTAKGKGRASIRVTKRDGHMCIYTDMTTGTQHACKCESMRRTYEPAGSRKAPESAPLPSIEPVGVATIQVESSVAQRVLDRLHKSMSLLGLDADDVMQRRYVSHVIVAGLSALDAANAAGSEAAE